MKRNALDTKFGGPKEQDILCSSESKASQKNLQYYRSDRIEDPSLSFLDQGKSAMMYSEAGKNTPYCYDFQVIEAVRLCRLRWSS